MEGGEALRTQVEHCKVAVIEAVGVGVAVSAAGDRPLHRHLALAGAVEGKPVVVVRVARAEDGLFYNRARAVIQQLLHAGAPLYTPLGVYHGSATADDRMHGGGSPRVQACLADGGSGNRYLIARELPT